MRSLTVLLVPFLLYRAACADQLSAVVADAHGRRIFLVKSENHSRLIRVHRDGSRDPSFSVKIEGYHEHESLAASPNGSLVVVGQNKRVPPAADSPALDLVAQASRPLSPRNQLVVTRVSSHGEIESTKKYVSILDEEEQITAVALTDAGEVLLAGSDGLRSLTIQRLLPTGPDNDFGSSGLRRIRLGRKYAEKMVYGFSDLRVRRDGSLRLVVRLIDLDSLEGELGRRNGIHVVLDVARDGKTVRAVNLGREPDFANPLDLTAVALDSQLSRGARYLYVDDINSRQRIVVRRFEIRTGRRDPSFGSQIFSGVPIPSLSSQLHLTPSGEVSVATRRARDLVLSDRDPKSGAETHEIEIKDLFDGEQMTCSAWLSR